MVAHSLISGRLRQKDHQHDFEVALGYLVSSRPAWTAERDPVSKNQNK